MRLPLHNCRYGITVEDASWQSWRSALLRQVWQKSGTLDGLLVSEGTKQAFADIVGVEPGPAPGGVEPDPAPDDVEPDPAPDGVELGPAPGGVEPDPGVPCCCEAICFSAYVWQHVVPACGQRLAYLPVHDMLAVSFASPV